MARMRKHRKRRFRVFFGGREAGFVEAVTMPDVLRKLDLTFCTGRREPARRLCPGHALHGHVPRYRDDRESHTVSFPPPIGRVPYDLRFPIAPPVTIHEAPPAA